MAQVRVENVAEKNRYEAYRNDALAGFVDYQTTAELVVLTHTEVDPNLEGQGIGGALAQAVLEDIRRRELKALAVCPFILSWVDRHPAYADVLYGAPPSRVTD